LNLQLPQFLVVASQSQERERERARARKRDVRLGWHHSITDGDWLRSVP
jgi:hypothetical protein